MITLWCRARTVLASVLWLMLMLASAPGRATVIVDTFGPGDTFNPTSAWVFRGANSHTHDPGLEQGFAFTVGPTSIVLTDIYIALSYNTETHNRGDLLLMTDSAGVPDSIIKSYAVRGTEEFGKDFTPTHIVDALGPTLLADTRYWLIGSAPTDAGLYWNLNDQGISGDRAFRRPPLPFSVADDEPLGAFRVEGTESIPEPSTLALLAAGAIGLVRRRS